jgi:hypothetical protein
VSCVADHQRSYDFVDSYERAAHCQFLNVKNDRDLASFIESFGPLCMTTTDGGPVLRLGKVIQPVSSSAIYWGFQRWLRALLQLIAALKQSRRIREAALCFLDADLSGELGGHGFHSLRLKPRAGISLAQLKIARQPAEYSGSIKDWLRDASDSLVGEAAAVLIQASIVVESRLRVRLKKRGSEVVARPVLRSLADAIEWMCWQDEFRQRPLVFCTECGKVFQPRSAHARKYCDDKKCGQRVASRNYRRRTTRRRKKEGRRSKNIS